MSSRKFSVVVGSLASCALLSLSAQAQIPFTVTPTYSANQFGAGLGGYYFGDNVLPGGTTIGSAPLELDLSFANNITLASVGFGYEYGIGVGSFSPLIQPGDDAFTFAVELLENGNLITPTFAYDVANPFTFGFDENNPFTFPVSDLGTGYTTTGLANSLTFNQVDIQLTSANPNAPIGITDVSFQLGVVPTPDATNALPLLSLGLLGLWAFGLRKTNASRRSVDGSLI